MTFVVPIIWANAGEHNELNCYANKCAVDVSSAQIQLPHSDYRLVPKCRKIDVLSTVASTFDSVHEDPLYEAEESLLIDQQKFDSIIFLGNAGLLFKFKQPLDPGVKAKKYRRHKAKM